jgi:hypothetical protein
VPRSTAVPAQPEPPQDDESYTGSPNYFTYDKQGALSTSSSSGQFSSPLASPGEHPSSLGPQASYGASSTISSLAQQFSDLSTSSTAQGYALSGFGRGVAPQSMGGVSSIERNFQRSTEQPGEYGGVGYRGGSYGQITSTGAQPSVDPFYGRQTQQSPSPISPLSGNLLVNSLCTQPLSSNAFFSYH